MALGNQAQELFPRLGQSQPPGADRRVFVLRAAPLVELPQEPRDAGVFGIDAVDFQEVPAVTGAGSTVRSGQVRGEGLGHAVGVFRHAEDAGVVGADFAAAQPAQHPTLGRRALQIPGGDARQPARRIQHAQHHESAMSRVAWCDRARSIVPPPGRQPGPGPEGNAAGEAVPRFCMGDNLVPLGKSYDLHTQISVIPRTEASNFGGIAAREHEGRAEPLSENGSMLRFRNMTAAETADPHDDAKSGHDDG